MWVGISYLTAQFDHGLQQGACVTDGRFWNVHVSAGAQKDGLINKKHSFLRVNSTTSFKRTKERRHVQAQRQSSIYSVNSSHPDAPVRSFQSGHEAVGH